MKYLSAILFTVTTVLFAQCPLGFTPDGACDAGSPSCGLFVDGNGDNFCDNPGPQAQTVEPEPEPELEPELEPESVPEPEQEIESATEPTAVSCPFGLSVSEACASAEARCGLYADSNGDDLCDNPGPQLVAVQEPEEPQVSEVSVEPDFEVPVETEIEEELIPADSVSVEHLDCPMGYSRDQVCSVEDPFCALFQDNDADGSCDNGIEAAIQEEPCVLSPETVTQLCPLGFSVEEACSQESPSCALFLDANKDSRCDNPGTVAETEAVAPGDEAKVVIGCPYNLSSAAACPDSLALCPHWFGVASNTTCSNPAGGQRRVNIILITLAVLMPVSTWLSRRFYGKRLKDKLNRNTAHHVVRGVSLMILGFGVQGCFCPLGTFQYAFTARGFAFLGVSGLMIFLIPLVFSAFFGRVFCGWVCPMGALQEFFYRIHIPGRVSPSGRIHHMLRHLSKVILFALVALILLNRFELITLKWPAPFCAIDPFHTIFSLFLSGNLIIAGITIILSIFRRRFFCRYLCFYGAALSIVGRLCIWNRIKGKRAEKTETDSDEEFDK